LFPKVRAITFDAGQTLVELDTAMLARRAGERGVTVSAEALEAALPAAWRRHEEAVARGARHPWKVLMAAVLEGAGGDELVDWLFDEQPRANLWRRPVPGMRELVEELHARGVPMAIVSNSEGRLAALMEDLGWANRFVAIADSGVLGIAKPDVGIFTWTLERLDVPAAAVVHVGDSYEADVEGALAAGLRAVWFGPVARAVPDERVVACPDAAALRRTIARWIE
jgi:putative hydrolase of the HAD superfamily